LGLPPTSLIASWVFMGINFSPLKPKSASALNIQAGLITTMQLQDRVREAMEGAGLKPSELATRTRKSRGAVTQWLDGTIKSLKADTAALIESATGYSSTWLVTGKGEKLAAGRASATEVLADVETPYLRPNLRNLQRAPIVGNTQGGQPDRMWTDGDHPTGFGDGYIEVATEDKNAFACRVVGDSMWPKYKQGDYCVMLPNKQPEIEDEVLVRLVTGETLLKRLLGRRGVVRLGSYNDPEVLTYDPDQIVWMYFVLAPFPAFFVKHWIETEDYCGPDRRWVNMPGSPKRREEDDKT
jgi:phage repressor protein C with HTH and peptisase S24 domain